MAHSLVWRLAAVCLSVALLPIWRLHPVAGSELSATSLPVLGVSVRGEIWDPGVQNLVRQAGVRWARTSVNWASVEPSPGVFNWSGLDAAIQRVAEAGASPLVLVTDNPSWAASTACGPIDRVPLSAFSTFVSALAGRYNGTTQSGGSLLPRVDYWEFYNEPDNQQMSEAWLGGCWGLNGAAYAQMLAAAWSAAHAANPQAQIVFGPIAGEYVDWNGGRLFNFNWQGGDFTDDVLSYMQAHPTSTYFDVFNIHYFPAFHTNWDCYWENGTLQCGYNLYSPPPSSDPPLWGVRGKAYYFAQRMARWGIPRPIICTETGRRSDAGQTIDGIPGSDEEQSRYVVRLFVEGMAAGLRGMIWFTLGDVSQNNVLTAWGLLNGSNQAKPAYTSIRVLIQQLGVATYLHPRAGIPNTAEGYVFSLPDASRRHVVWSRDAADKLIAFTASWLHVTDKWGQERMYFDGQPGDEDGTANGQVLLRVGGSPLYVDPGTGALPTATPTATGTATRTQTSTPTATRTATPTATRTGTATVTATLPPAATQTPTRTATQSGTATSTGTATRTGTATATATQTGTPTRTGTVTQTGTATRTGTATGTATRTGTATQTGTVTQTGTRTATGTIAASPTTTPSPTRTPTALPGCPDAYEPDNSAPQGKPIEDGAPPQRHNFNIALDTDWLRFPAFAGVTYTMWTSNLAGGTDTVMRLRDAQGNMLASNDDDPGLAPGQSRIIWPVVESGMYYLEISDYNPATTYGCATGYDVQVQSGAPVQTATPTRTATRAPGASATATATTPTTVLHLYFPLVNSGW